MPGKPPRICLLNPSPPSVSPRLVRNADALACAGFEVVVVTTRFSKRLLPHDQPLPRREWTHEFVDMTDSLPGKVRWQFGRARRKLCLALARHFPAPLLVKRACTYAGLEMAKLASRQRAALYLAHTHAALPAASDAARRTGARLAFDVEDLLAECSDEPTRVMRSIEDCLVPHCAYLSTMSLAAALRLQETLRLASLPLVLHNTPSLAEREGVRPPAERPRSDRLRIYWFGQTIGPHSCADQVVRALPLLSKPAKLVLRGNSNAGYVTELESLAAGLGLKDCLEVHPRALPGEMVRLAAANDVMLGSQPSSEPFHQMAIGNKVFTGLMAGLAVALTDTTAHRLLLPDLPGCGFLFPNNDPRALAGRLNELASSGDKLLAAKSAAWRLGEDRFNWERESQPLIEQIEKLVGRPR